MKSIEPPAEWASKMLINLIPPELTSQTSKNLKKNEDLSPIIKIDWNFLVT